MKKPLSAICCLLAAGVLLSGCAKKELYAYTSFAYFGSVTNWAFVSKTEEKDAAVWAELNALERTVENSVSLSLDSYLTAFNAADAGERVALDGTAYEILQTAMRMYEETGGAYNPAVGLLVDLWGFSPRHVFVGYAPETAYDREDYTTELPDPAYIEAFLPLTDFSAVALGEDGNGYYAVKPDLSAEIGGVTYTMQLNLGGIGKGWCADGAEEILLSAGYTEGYFSLGGSSICVLKNPSDSVFEIGVNSPRSALGKQIVTVFAADTRIATSGDYEQYYEIGGLRYCHIIDPATGYPVNASPGADGSGVISATVLGGSAAEGDALATALIVMGEEAAIAFARTLSVKVAFVCYHAADDAYLLYTNLSPSEYSLTAELTEVSL